MQAGPRGTVKGPSKRSRRIEGSVDVQPLSIFEESFILYKVFPCNVFAFTPFIVKKKVKN
jgi:hypothetical protein